MSHNSDAGPAASTKEKLAPKKECPVASSSKIDDKKRKTRPKLDENTVITLSSETTVHLISSDTDEATGTDGQRFLRIDPSHPINVKIPTNERIRRWMNLIPHDVEQPDSEIFDYSDTIYSNDRSLSNLSKQGDDETTWSYDIEEDAARPSDKISDKLDYDVPKTPKSTDS